MTNTRTEIRNCSSFTSRGMCGVEFLATIEGLDSGYRTCERCRKLPTVAFHLVGVERNRAITILDGRVMQTGERGENHEGRGIMTWATVRRFVARAKADGVTGIAVHVSRHTQESGWTERRWIRL